MFGTWILEIQADLRKRFPSTKDYKPVDFKCEPMPVSVGHFLEHALARRAALVKVSVDSAWFDVSNQDVIEGEKQWRKALRASARYPAGLWAQSIDQAVAHIVSFLVSPADSFCEFVFSNTKGDIHPRIILHRLEYFTPLSVLREVIRGYAERKEGELVSKEDLRAAILKADRSIVANYEPSDWIALLRPLYDLASVMVVGDHVPELPTSVLKPVFEAKAVNELLHRIEAIESISGRRMLTESSLLTVIGPTEVAPVAAPVAVPVVAPDLTPDPVSQPVSRNDMHAQPSDDEAPRWMQFTSSLDAAKGGELGDGGPRNPSLASPGADELVEIEGIPMPMRLGERARLPEDLVSVESHFGVSPEIDPHEQRVLNGISPVQRNWFVNNLFGGDLDDFSRVMSMLDGAADWEAAAHVIGAEVFERYDVDIYSQPAVEFTNVVELRYQ